MTVRSPMARQRVSELLLRLGGIRLDGCQNDGRGSGESLSLSVCEGGDVHTADPGSAA